MGANSDFQVNCETKSAAWKWIKLAIWYYKERTADRRTKKKPNRKLQSDRDRDRQEEHCEDAQIMASDGYCPCFNLRTAILFFLERGAAAHGGWKRVGARRIQFRSRNFIIWLHIGRLLRPMVRPLQASFSGGTFSSSYSLFHSCKLSILFALLIATLADIIWSTSGWLQHLQIRKRVKQWNFFFLFKTLVWMCRTN